MQARRFWLELAHRATNKLVRGDLKFLIQIVFFLLSNVSTKYFFHGYYEQIFSPKILDGLFSSCAAFLLVLSAGWLHRY